MKKNILVTGAAGFVGSKICDALLAEGYQVFGVDDYSRGQESRVHRDVEMIPGDINALRAEKLPISKLDAILHLAGQSSGEYSFYNPIEDLRRNYESTVSVVKLATTIGVNKILHASSMSVYGETRVDENNKFFESSPENPISNYGVSKLAAEKFLAAQKNFESLSLRMFNVYGPGQDLKRMDQGMVSIFLAQALTSKRIEVKGAADRTRDFVYIDDVVEVWIRALHIPLDSHTNLNVGTGTGTSVRTLLDKIQTLVPEARIEFSNSTPSDQITAVASTLRLQQLIGFTPDTSISDGLTRFCNQAREELGVESNPRGMPLD